MSQSWKGEGSSFNSLVKSNRIVAVQEHAFQTYILPDSTNSGIDAEKAFAKVGFQNANIGKSATNEITFQGAVFGADASASLLFTDTSGAVGWIAMRTSAGPQINCQNILLTDTSGESLLLILDNFQDYIDPVTLIARDPSWNWPPGSFNVIGVGSPPGGTGLSPVQGGTLGAITVFMGQGITAINDEISRALQLSRAIGDSSGENFYWSDKNVWDNYPKLEISAKQGSVDSSLCFIWQDRAPLTVSEINRDISYNPDPSGAGANETFLQDYTEWFPTGTDGSFNQSNISKDLSLNIILQDTSGETLKIIFDVDISMNADASWNAIDSSGSLGSVIIPMGKPHFDVTKVEAEIPPNYVYTPDKSDRAKKFINVINVSTLEIKAQEGSNDGEVELIQDYGGITGNADIIFDPSLNETWNESVSIYPLDASYNWHDASFSPFIGGTDVQDVSQNITLKDVCGNEVLFKLNVDLSANNTDGTINYPYLIPAAVSDPSTVMIPMDGSNNRRITDVNRALQFWRAINNTALYTPWPPLYIYAGKTGGSLINSAPDASSVTLTHYYPGVLGNDDPGISGPYITYDPTKSELLMTTDISRVPIFPFSDPSGFSGGIDPIDTSQNIILKSNLSGLETTFILNVDMSLISDPSGPDPASFVVPGPYTMHVPMGSGKGLTLDEIEESAKTRAANFLKALNQIRDITEPYGYCYAWELDVTNFPSTQSQAGVLWDNNGGILYQPNANLLGNYDISFNPSPIFNDAPTNYDASGFPLKLNTSQTINSLIYNSEQFGGGIDDLSATDDFIRSQSGINIKGGANINVTGDQKSNTITITSTQPDAQTAPLWTLGKGAGTGTTTIFSVQTINPGMNTGLYGAGGDYAVAGGFETKALGEYSCVFGESNIAIGKNSFSMGSNCSSEAVCSTTFGASCFAQEDYSVAFGFQAYTGIKNDITIRKTDAVGTPLQNPDKNIVFAIGSEFTYQTTTANPTAKFHNILEIDVCGNLWTASLGPISKNIVSWERTDPTKPKITGLYVNNVDNNSVSAGFRSLAAGYNSQTYGACSFVDGSSVIIGTISGGGDFSVGFGEGNTISDEGNHSIIAGKDNIITNNNCACFGGGNKCGGPYTFSSGYQCDASGDYSIAMGINSKSEGFYSVALGGANYAFGESSVALGRNARAIGFISTSIGCHCEASGNFSVAIGRDSTVHHDASNSVALGYNNTVRGENSVALGTNSTADGSGSFAVLGGYASSTNSIAIGLDCSAVVAGGIAIGKGSTSSGTYSLSIGLETKAIGDYSVAIGSSEGKGSKGEYSITIGQGCLANDNYSVAIGDNCDASGIGSLAVGWKCQANSFQDPSGWLPNISSNGLTETSIAFGMRGDTRLTAAWRGGKTGGPGDGTDANAAWFRKKNGGIVFAIGASGESYYPEIYAAPYNTPTSYTPPIYGPDKSILQDADSGNIFEIYANGKIWTTSLNVLVPISDASSAKWVHPINSVSRALIKAESGNSETALFNKGLGAVVLGNNSSANGAFSTVGGRNCETTEDASYSLVVGLDCSANSQNCLVVGNSCIGGNENSVALGIAGNSGTSSSGGDISSNDLIFAIGVSGESYRGNVFEIDVSGSVWTKNLGTLSSTIPALGAVPIGGIVPFAGTQSVNPPVNWLWCDGANGSGIDGSSSYIDHTINPEYEPLFLVISQSYGTGPAGVGFRVPMLEQRFPTGVTDFGSPTDIGNSVYPVGGNPNWSGTTDISGGNLAADKYEGYLMRYIIRYK